MRVRKGRDHTHSIDLLFTVVMFLVYAVSLLTFVYLGANVYQSVTIGMDHHDEVRSAQAYLTEKIRQHDVKDAVYVTAVEDEQALAIEETIQGSQYVTYIYADDGSLCELWIPKDREPKKQDGTQILPMKKLSLEEQDNGLLRFSFWDEQDLERAVVIKRKSGE